MRARGLEIAGDRQDGGPIIGTETFTYGHVLHVVPLAAGRLVDTTGAATVAGGIRRRPAMLRT